MLDLEVRFAKALPDHRFILWEGNPQTFEFSYVSPGAEGLLGYPRELWLTDPEFWCSVVVHPDDRHDAVAFCALATGNKLDHDFEYRARHRDGRLLWLHDVVKVIVGPRGVPVNLRGVMIDVTDQH